MGADPRLNTQPVIVLRAEAESAEALETIRAGSRDS